MSLVAVVRIPAPRESPFGSDAWESAVGQTVPVRIADPRGREGTSPSDAVCTAAQVGEDGSHVDITLSVFVDDPSLVLGLFVPGEIISIREGE